MSFKLIPVAITQIVNALERESANTDTDPRWLSAAEMRRMANWENRTLMCFIDEDPKVIVMGSGNAMTEPARYLSMNRSELIALCERYEADNERLLSLCQRWSEGCTGRHGSQQQCITPETACDHRWSAPTPPGCSCSKCGLVVPTPVNKSHPNPSGEPK